MTRSIHRPLALAVVLMACAQGCALFNPDAPTPEARRSQQIASAEELLTSAMTTADELSKYGYIPQAGQDRLLEFAKSASTALDEARTAHQAENATGFRVALAAFRSALKDLNAWVAQGNTAKSLATK